MELSKTIISFDIEFCWKLSKFFFSMQKYRLHTRRVPAAKSAPANQSVVVLGDLWMSQDHYDDSSKANSSQSGSPQGPLQLAENGGDDDEEEEDDDDDAKSESYSWKSHIHKPGKDDV